MKVLQISLLTVMVAIAMEKCVTKYLLVEIEDEIGERQGSMLNARTANKCECRWDGWGKWGPCSESCGSGFTERTCTNTTGHCNGLPKETQRCQMRTNNCEPPKSGYSLIADHGGCQLVSGTFAFSCKNYDVSSQSLCQDHCTAMASCIGYDYRWSSNSHCGLIPSERSCPSGFTPDWAEYWNTTAASMNDLVPYPYWDFVCYGKSLGIL